jgi:molybdate transport system substrate-binding protein
MLMAPRSLAPLLALALFACQAEETRAPAPETELVVFAASSLREAFTTLGQAFEQAHPEATISFNFAGSQELRTQLEHGASADVFASADEEHTNELERARLVGKPIVFARNEPVIVVAREQAGTVLGLADLPKAERIVVGVPEVPIGRYTLQILDRAATSLGPDFRARVEAKVVSRELNVRQVLAKVALGEAQAGIVYRTDASAAAEKLSVVALPPELNVVARYPIAAVSAAPHPELAQAWIAFVVSPDGQRSLVRTGFLPMTAGGP